jgi:hypothetical protein
MKRFVGYLISKTPRAKKVAPTITQPKQLKKTMKKIGEKYKYSSAREKEYIKRIDKVQKLKDKRKEGVKAGKDLKKMVDTKQAEKIGKRIYSKQVPDKRTKGTGKKGEFVVDKIERKGKMFGGIIGKKKKKEKREKREAEKGTKPKDLIYKPKKMERLEELRKQLEGMKKGGKAKFPDLTGDGKVTKADILKGRGVFKKGGGVKQAIKTITSPITRLRNKMSKRKFGGAKGKK